MRRTWRLLSPPPKPVVPVTFSTPSGMISLMPSDVEYIACGPGEKDVKLIKKDGSEVLLRGFKVRNVHAALWPEAWMKGGRPCESGRIEVGWGEGELSFEDWYQHHLRCWDTVCDVCGRDDWRVPSVALDRMNGEIWVTLDVYTDDGP